MSQAHHTTEPEQVETDTFAVFAWATNLELIKRVEVPRYSQPASYGTELSRDKRLSLAVYRAVNSEQTMIPNPFKNRHDHVAEEGREFVVTDDLDGDFETVEYEENPAFEGVWNPEKDV